MLQAFDLAGSQLAKDIVPPGQLVGGTNAGFLFASAENEEFRISNAH